MAECNMPGCSTSSLCDSLASDTRFTTVSSDGEDVEDSGEAASDSSSRTSAEPESILRVSNLKYESVRIDFKTVVFIRANPGKKPDESGSHVNFIQKQCSFLEVVSPKKWYVTNIKPWA